MAPQFTPSFDSCSAATTIRRRRILREEIVVSGFYRLVLVEGSMIPLSALIHFPK